MNLRKNPLHRLYHLIGLHRKEIYAIYVYSLINGIVELSLPLGVQTIIGFVLGATMVTSLYILIALVVLGVLVVGIIQTNQMKIIEKIQQRIFVDYAFDFGSGIPKFDLKKLDAYYLPEKINHFFDTINVQKGFSKLLLDLPLASIQVLLGILLLSIYHPVFLALGISLVIILFVIFKYTGIQGFETSLVESKNKYQVVAWFEEVARTIKSFKFGKIDQISLQKTDGYVDQYLHSRTKHFQVLLFQFRALVGAKVFVTFGTLAIGTFLLLNQELNIGEFIAAEIVILMVIGAVEKLIKSLESVYDVLTGLEKLAQVSESDVEKSGSLELSKKSSAYSLEVRNLSFGFEDNQQVLKNISVHIDSNQKVCISGGSGSGKSTFIRVLSGNYSDFQGSILLNNIPIQNYQLASLREHLGVYLKHQDIFSGSLWENIALGRPSIRKEGIVELSETLGFKHFLEYFPLGFDTHLDPTGKKIPFTLSKKILLLRALAHQPQLLLMEEPWADMELELKESLQNYFLNLKNTTCLIVSNDPGFSSRCDQVIRLDEGKLN